MICESWTFLYNLGDFIKEWSNRGFDEIFVVADLFEQLQRFLETILEKNFISIF